MRSHRFRGLAGNAGGIPTDGLVEHWTPDYLDTLTVGNAITSWVGSYAGTALTTDTNGSADPVVAATHTRRTVQFTSGTYRMLASGVWGGGFGDITMIVVLQYTAAQQGERPFGAGISGSGEVGVYFGGDGSIRFNDGAIAGSDTSALHVRAIRRTTGGTDTYTMRLDDTLVLDEVGDGSRGTLSNDYFAIGHTIDDLWPDCHIGEAAIYDTSLADTDLLSAITTMNARWGIY